MSDYTFLKRSVINNISFIHDLSQQYLTEREREGGGREGVSK